MLAQNHVCIVQSQNFKIMQQQYMQSHLTGDNISVLCSLRQMLADNSNMTYLFACEAYKRFISSGLCKESDFQNCYEQLAIYGIAMSNLFLCYSTKTDKLALYTSSYTILEHLASKGLLKGKKNPIAIELQSFKEILVNSQRIKSSIKKGGVIQAVRLDPEICGESVVFTATTPRSQLSISEDIFIAFQAMDMAMGYLNQILQDKMLRFTMGDKVRVVTKNFSMLSMLYGEARARYLVSKGYDSRIESFYVPSVGASIYTAGLTNIRLIDVDKIEVMQSLDGVDLSEIKTDYTKAKEFFLKSVKGMKADSIHKLGDICSVLSPNLNKVETIEYLKSYPNMVTDRQLYALMKEHSDMFNMAEFDKMPSKYGTEFAQLDVPTSKKELEDLFKTGVFKVLITSRKGGMSTVICTNSPKELARVYGKAYYSSYESEGNRLRALERLVKAKYVDGISRDDLQKITSKYGLSDIFTEVIMSGVVVGDIDYDTVMRFIYIHENSIENRKTVIKQPHLITVRSCTSEINEDGYAVDFYKNIDPRSILSIVRLSTVSNK